MIGEIWFFFLCYVYNQIQHKLQMSSNDRDYWGTQQHVGETNADATARVKAARAAARTADAAGTAGTADAKAENAIRRQPYMAIPCTSCRIMAETLNNPNYKCHKCRYSQGAQGGSKRKSKSHRRKKSKSQRRKKSIKRRH